MPRGLMAKQRGAVMMIALMFLLLLTMIGLSSSNVSLMQERMAGSVYQSNLSFQMAEATLRVAEQHAFWTTEARSGGIGVFPSDPPLFSTLSTNANDCTLSAYVIPDDDWICHKIDDGSDGLGELYGEFFAVEMDSTACVWAQEAGGEGMELRERYYLLTARFPASSSNCQSPRADASVQRVVQSIYMHQK